MKVLSHVRLFATPWTAADQAPLPMGFSRQEYWSGLSLPSLAALPSRSQLMLTRRIHSRGKVESYSLCRESEIETWKKKMVQLASELLWYSNQNLALPHLGEI